MADSCNPSHCEDHSGLLMWMKGIAVLVTGAVGLLSYSVFWQAPNIRIDIVKEVARLDARDSDTASAIKNIQNDIGRVETRVAKLEARRGH